MIFREGTKEIGRVLYRERVEAAVDNANRTGHGLGGIGGQIMKGSHQFIRLQETADRSMGENRMRTRCKRTVLIGQQGAVLVRQQETRRNRIDTNAFAELHRQFRTEIFGPVSHRSLGHAVTGHTRERTESGLGSKIDDGTFT